MKIMQIFCWQDIIPMSKAEKYKFDFINYLKSFRKFMLSVSFYTDFIYFVSIIFLTNETRAIIYAVSLSLPWPYFIIISNNRFIK